MSSALQIATDLKMKETYGSGQGCSLNKDLHRN